LPSGCISCDDTIYELALQARLRDDRTNALDINGVDAPRSDILPVAVPDHDAGLSSFAPAPPRFLKSLPAVLAAK